jgi:hypothetical protein
MAFLLREASSDISVFLEIASCIPFATTIVSYPKYIGRLAPTGVARDDGVTGLPQVLLWLIFQAISSGSLFPSVESSLESQPGGLGGMTTSKVLVLELTACGSIVGRPGDFCLYDNGDTDNKSLSCISGD